VQQGLAERAKPTDLLDVVTRLGGVQAQLMAAAELALGVRVDGITPSAVQRLLWDERTLFKTWAMRGTLHLLPTAQFGQFVAASAATTPKRPPSYYTYHKVTPAELEAILAAVPAVLSATPITREQLADAVAEQTGNAKLREVLLSGWGALLKPSARRGHICFGPNMGQNVTFVRPERWLAVDAIGEPEAALQAVARRFLATYGPATLDEFARWWGIDAAQARKLFKTLADELTTVDVEGWTAQILTSTLDAIRSSPAVHSVHLLPYFDPYTIAVARHSDYLLPPACKAQVYRAQGWISPVVLVDGQIVGVWAHENKRDQVMITVTLFNPSSKPVEADIAMAAEQLGKFLGHAVQLEITLP